MNQEKIEHHFKEIMEAMKLDLGNDSLSDTPKRVAKMFTTELFSGLNPDNFPKITTHVNEYGYNQMLVETNIKVHSTCEHHFVPIIGRAHIAYIPNEKIIGLSKFNRIVDHFSRRPQVQERLTNQILDSLKENLETVNVAVVIDAVHMCVMLRGIKDQTTVTRTTSLSGLFFDETSARSEFLSALPKPSEIKFL